MVPVPHYLSDVCNSKDLCCCTRTEQKTADNVRSMSNQRDTAHHPSAMPSDEIQCLQSEMARLTAHVVGLKAQQTERPQRNLMPSMTPSVSVQNTGDRPSGAHLQMCSYHGGCIHNDTSCRAQQPDCTDPSNAAANGTGCCYFCQMRAHPTD
uniref:Uncharacterized protein n=1 Tax=Romanomermis culicivorax TaxID=13658 RepID=A0A915KNA7_ROMCU